MEVAMVERRDLHDSVSFGGSNDGRIDAAKRQVVILGRRASRQSARLGGRGSDDLLDPLGDACPPAMTGGRRAQVSAWTDPDVCLDRIACELGDRRAAPFSLVTKPGVQVV
jgi:hypothetical protein